ncbi:D-serine dehydratase transcriptional activator (fragment) [Vibrio tapetis subsp. tapetis]|uniref:D-serine dehydratase transcriptional activator n=1 Tax=Vibrio tapetis subsp. tapetis TaxID=1671868 RepID=A0A2N8ZBB1_9VIBR
MRLTAEGELLRGFTEQAFQALDTGVNKLVQMKSQSLEVSCEPTLTMRWLMPRLSDFHLSSGGDVRLSTAGGPVNLGVSGLSMAIRRDDFEILHDYSETSLVDEWVGPVCSLDYWQSVKSDLGQIKLLHSQTRPQAWHNWCANASVDFSLETANQTFAHFYFCFQAAVDGLGAAIGSYPLIVDDLKRGNLIAPFGFVRSGHRYMLLSQQSVSGELANQFTQWLQHNLRQSVPTAEERNGLL